MFPMEAATIALILAVIGAILIAVEALNPGIFLVIPGTILLIIGIVGFIFPDFLMSIYSPILAIVLAIPVTLLTIKGYQYLAKPVPPETTVSDALIGKKGKVVVATTPDSIKGKVRLGREIWSADSDEVIEEGASVIVISAEGVHVKVEKIA